MLDAIGITISELKKKKNILFVILTDGHENSSEEFTVKQIKELVEEKKEKYNWKFLFLGADITDFRDVEIFGMANYITVNKNKVKEIYGQLNKTINHFCEDGKVKFENKKE